MKNYLLIGLVFGVLLPTISFAQTSTVYCPTLSTSLQKGARGGQVTELQKFLASYFNLNSSTIVTGYFGPTTQSYILKLQAQQGVPTIGVAGPMTRATIMRICDSHITSGQTVPTLSSMTPTQGAVGIQITVTGSGFLQSNDYALLDGQYDLDLATQIMPTSDTSFSFILPPYMYDKDACSNKPSGRISSTTVYMTSCDPAAIDVQPGQHSLSIQTSNGISNSLPFTITSK